MASPSPPDSSTALSVGVCKATTSPQDEPFPSAGATRRSDGRDEADDDTAALSAADVAATANVAARLALAMAASGARNRPTPEEVVAAAGRVEGMAEAPRLVAAT
mmetsp:Transcript_42483/g.134952  ORF Transcript_42483/g.134952 Transcript_42483/m.134952 type:complete len:105 (-) Transcript_42483:333-647(-)